MSLVKDFKREVSFYLDLLRDHSKNKYLTYTEAVSRWFANRNVKYSFRTLSEVAAERKSDTVFVLGCGPSLNWLTSDQIKEINKHATFGINHSFLKNDIKPTYQQISYEVSSFAKQYIVRNIKQFDSFLKSTVFFIHQKTLARFCHPRLFPDFFPKDPICCKYTLKKGIDFDQKRDFLDSDFDRTLIYRGTLTVVLDLVTQMGFKKIVLLGVDPQTRNYFFEEYPEMKEYCERLYKNLDEQKITMFRSQHPNTSKPHTIEHYLHRLQEYLLKKEIHLYTGFSKNSLSRILPAYFKS